MKVYQSPAFVVLDMSAEKIVASSGDFDGELDPMKPETSSSKMHASDAIWKPSDEKGPHGLWED